jgi:hypothetical protein
MALADGVHLYLQGWFRSGILKNPNGNKITAQASRALSRQDNPAAKWMRFGQNKNRAGLESSRQIVSLFLWQLEMGVLSQPSTRVGEELCQESSKRLGKACEKLAMTPETGWQQLAPASKLAALKWEKTFKKNSSANFRRNFQRISQEALKGSSTLDSGTSISQGSLESY